MEDDGSRLRSHVRVVFRCLLLISKQRANSDTVDVARCQVLEEYDSFLNSNHIRRAVEHIEIRKVEGSIRADNSDTAERRRLGINTCRVCVCSWRKAWIFGDVNGRERTVENIQFIAHWNRKVCDVIFTIVRDVQATRENVQVVEVSGKTDRTMPYDLKRVQVRDKRNLS